MSFKTTDGLMRHLRENGIAISGSKEKRQLINTGYFHGYKGYRFFRSADRPIPFTKYSEIYATIKYDSDLKALLYRKLMYIETAVKNVALERILKDANSENIQDMYDRVISSYSNLPSTASEPEKKKAQENKLRLENQIQSALLKAYQKKNPKITHFYNNMNYGAVPLWALFEILTMGDFAHLLSCLTITTRAHVSRDLGMDVPAIDTNRELIYKYLYALKDLRNAVAHNAVVFDTRFREFDPSPAMRSCVKQEFNLPFFNLKSIDDYIILICYYLKILHVSKNEIKAFIREFERITEEYKASIDSAISQMVIHPDLTIRIACVKNSI